MKAEKIDEKILSSMSLNEYVSATFLADKIKCTEKTVRQHIQILNDVLSSYGVQIQSKHGHGYSLVVKSREQFQRIYSNGRLITNFLQISSADRADYIISYLLLHWNYVDLMDLCEVLNVSESTLSNDIKAAKEILKTYRLSIIAQRKKGVRIEGKEFDIRLCMTDYLDISKVLNSDQIAKIHRDKLQLSQIILEVLSVHNASMPEVSMENLINHLYISILRLRTGNAITMISEDCAYLRNYDPDAVNIVKKICARAAVMFGVQFTDCELDYILIYMIGQRLNRSINQVNYNIVIPNQTLEFVQQILDFIYNTLNLDFRDNFSLIMNLALHMLPLVVRLKYNMRVQNPLLYEIKKNYSLGFTIALQAGLVIEKRMKQKLSEDEIGYLALIFEVSLVKQNKKKDRQRLKNIVIVCATGRTSAELLAYQYRKVFGEYINKIQICNIHELINIDFKTIDYIFTTTPIQLSVPVPIIETKFFLDSDQILSLQQEFEKVDQCWLRKYYNPCLFLSELECESKEEVLSALCKTIRKVENVPDDFFKSVLEREAIGSTDFGEMIAMPHPYERISENTFTCVCTLKKPVFWGRQDVSVVILISVAEDKPEDLEQFYQVTSEFLLNHTKAKRLLKQPTYENFIRLLNSAD